MGNVLFKDGEWSNGKIVIDIENESSYDKIDFEGSFQKTGKEIPVKFLFDANSIPEAIQTSESDIFILGDSATYAEKLYCLELFLTEFMMD